MYIPNDIIVTNILSRLPSKTLVRFLCVSASWYSLITDDYFQTLYSIVNKAEKRRWIAFPHKRNAPLDYTSAHFILYDEASPFVVSSSLENNELRHFPLSSKERKRLQGLMIIASCNGLVCLYVRTGIDHSCSSICLWNPFIRKCKRFDLPNICSNSTYNTWGFGFANRSHDYKFVVVIAYGYDKSEQGLYDIEVYSLRKMSWKRVIDAKLDEYVRVGMKQGCYLNGACHWICSRHFHTRVLMCFNLDDDNFYPMNLPKNSDSKRYFDTIVYKDMLSVCTYEDGEHNRNRFLDILAMKEYGCFDSWTFMVRVDLRPHLFCWSQLYGADSNGRLFFRERYYNVPNWKVYDPESKEIEFINTNVFELVSCQESLVFL